MEELDIVVSDVKGNTIEKLRTNQNKIDISHLSNGLYIVKISSNRKMSVHKLIKE